MKRNVRFVDPGRLYRNIKNEIDQAYFEVMTKGDLIDRGQLKGSRSISRPSLA
jgi:GTP1/Obg family GTP-binding protein